MNPIYIHFESFSPNIDAAAYVQNTLKGLSDYYIKLGGEKFSFKLENLQEFVRGVSNNSSADNIPLASSNEFPEFDEFYNKRIEIMISCAKSIIEEVSSLMNNEGDLLYGESYLSQDWKEFSQGCGVITRKSNQAVVNFLFPDALIGTSGTVNKDISNYPGAEVKTAKRSLRTQIEDPAEAEIKKSFVL